MLSEGDLEICLGYPEEELSALTADCELMWDDTKCACVSYHTAANAEPSTELVSFLVLQFIISMKIGCLFQILFEDPCSESSLIS